MAQSEFDKTEFAGKTALVTGAAAGLGLAIARRLAGAGARLVIADLDLDGLQALAKELGGGCLVEQVDVSDAESVEAMFQHIGERFTRLDLAVNNAGIGEKLNPTGEKSIEQWRKVMSINLDGVFYCLRQELKMMTASGGGAIVNVASVLGLNAFPGAAAYCAAKHGVVGLTKVAGAEYASQGVRVNAVAPAFINTPRVDANQQLTELEARHPIGRLGQPEEVAELTAFLLSNRANFINASCHLIDGAYNAY